MLNNILVVCIGNICRSPAAEYLLKHKLAHKSGLIIHSAGLGALVAKPIDSNTGQWCGCQCAYCPSSDWRDVVEGRFDFSDGAAPYQRYHRAGHQVSGKTFLLGKWSQNQPVPYPYRKSMEAFEHVYGQLDQFISDWLKCLK
ncbi:MAG: protein-tyrosine phosphatase [Zhongshania sp.]|jgi:protein-tyrosine phosphatase